jgi:alkanesulfonate monooxygenase SsuD/methylene tetrahydromethanopterin reductase-like flavin-dependent oxidoreductase (luciferase family)
VSDYDEINLLIEQLIAAWGSVSIECNGKTCQVSGSPLGAQPSPQVNTYLAATLLEALRFAAEYGVEE